MIFDPRGKEGVKRTMEILDEQTELASREESRKKLKAHQNAMLRLLREFDRVCKKLNIQYFLFAGTLLGAVRHQGFIPWDDDLDVIMPRKDYERFLREAQAHLDEEQFFLQKEFSENWPVFFSKLRLNGTTCLEAYRPKLPQCHQGVYMDIFPLDQGKNSDLGRKAQFLVSKLVIAKSHDARGYETQSILKKTAMCVSRAIPMKPLVKFVRNENDDTGWLHSFFAAAKKMERNVYDAKLFATAKEATFEGEQYPIPKGYEEVLRTMYGDYMRLPSPEERICKQHAILVDLDHSYEEYAHYRDGMRFEIKTKSIR